MFLLSSGLNLLLIESETICGSCSTSLEALDQDTNILKKEVYDWLFAAMSSYR